MMMPAPDAGGDLDEDRAVVAAADALPVLGQRAEVGVVLDVHGEAELLLGGGAGVDVLPAREDRRRADEVVGHRGGQAQADVAHRPVRGDHGLEHRAGHAERLHVVVAGREVAALLGQQVAGQVADGDRDVAVAEVHAGHEPRPAGQADGGTAAPAARVRLDQAAAGQLADDVGDRGRRQPGGPGQLGLGERRVVRARPHGRDAAQHVEHPLLVRRAQRGGGPRGRVGTMVGHGANCALTRRLWSRGDE